MKVLFYLDNYGVRSETFIIDQIKRINKAHNCILICKNHVGDLSIPNLKVIELRSPSKIFTKASTLGLSTDLWFSKYDPWLKNRITKIIEDYKPNVIHCYFGIQALSFLDNLKDKNIPVFITFLGYDATMMLRQKNSYQKKLRKILKTQDNVYPILICDYFKSLFDHEFNLSTKNCLRINLGIDNSKFIPLIGNKNESFTFIQIARFVSKKGIIDSVMAFSKFFKEYPNSMLKLIGDGPLREQIIESISKLQLTDCVKVLPWVNRSSAIKVLQSSHVFIHPSKKDNAGNEEGTPVSIMEAMSVGLPVISTFHAGIPEMLTKSNSSRLVKCDNINGLVEAMKSIYYNYSYPAYDNIKKVNNDYNVSKIVDQIENEYLKLIG